VSFLSSHRPAPEAPKPSTVVAEPATPEAAKDDYTHRGGVPAGHTTAQQHTFGRR
jgi:hypothetical protein